MNTVQYAARPETTLSLRAVNPWLFLTYFVGAIFIVPLFFVLSGWFMPDTARSLAHLMDTVLLRYVAGSLLLALGVGGGSLLLGTFSAWCVTLLDIPFRRFLSVALVLPLAIPAYVLAIVYGGWFEAAGPLQSWLRETYHLQVGQYWFFDMRSLEGAILVLSLALYPYIYLMASAAFARQSRLLSEQSRLLGLSTVSAFFRVTLPMARPALLAGLALVLMETLADFGVVSLFGVETLTSGIYRAWYGMYNMNAAMQLSTFLLGIVLVVWVIEYYARHLPKYHSQRQWPVSRYRPRWWKRWLVTVTLLGIVLAGFILPLLQLINWAAAADPEINDTILRALGNSLLLAALATTAITAISLLLALSKRFHASRFHKLFLLLATSGYALPGAVIAVGVLTLTLWIDRAFDSLVVTGSLAGLVLAYSIRFVTVSFQSVSAALDRVPVAMTESAKMLGAGRGRLVREVYLPQIRPGIFYGALLVAVDVIKELPASLMLRPFNFDTLAIKTYEYAGDSLLENASVPALGMIAAGMISMLVIHAAGMKTPSPSRGRGDGVDPKGLHQHSLSLNPTQPSPRRGGL